MQVKGASLADGIEIFPKQDQLRQEEFGNAIRAPLGVHWGARASRGWRYWYYGADYTLDDQLAYLKGLKKVTEQHLQGMIAGKTVPQEFAQQARRTESSEVLRVPAGRVPDSGLRRGAAAGRPKLGDSLPIVRRARARQERR